MWNLWVWLVGAVVRRYIDFLILLFPTPLVSVHNATSSPSIELQRQARKAYQLETTGFNIQSKRHCDGKNCRS